MIARTALDDGALRDLDEIRRTLAATGLDAQTLQGLNPHESLARLVTDYSVIQLRGSDDRDALVTAIRALDEESKSLWEETLLALIDCDRVRVGSDVHTTGDVLGDQDLPAGLDADLDLAVVSRRIASLRHLPNEGFTGRANPPELSTAIALGKCQTIRRIQDLERDQQHDAETPRGEIWDARFAPLARVATEVFIFDQFLFKVYTGVGDDGIEHVSWLLEMLDYTLPKLVPVTILAKDELKTARSSLAEWLRESQFNRNRPGMLTVHLCPWSNIKLTSPGTNGPRGRGSRPHNRHIRFSTWAALTAEEGFDRFREPEVWGVDGTSLYRVITHPSHSATGPSHIRTLRAKEQAVIRTSQWEWKSWSITYDLAGGQAENPSSYTNHSDAIALVPPTREGHTFAGWTGTHLEEPSAAVSIAAGSTGHRSYTATWKAGPQPASADAADGHFTQSAELLGGRGMGDLR